MILEDSRGFFGILWDSLGFLRILEMGIWTLERFWSQRESGNDGT